MAGRGIVKGGYVVVSDYEHRMVWREHHGEIPPGYHVHHKNGIRHDNRIENLELVHGGRHVADHQRGHTRNRGEKSGKWRTDLNSDEIVRLRDEEGCSFREIGRRLGASYTTVAERYSRATGAPVGRRDTWWRR